MLTLESNATQPWPVSQAGIVSVELVQRATRHHRFILHKARTGKRLTADYADNTDGK
jgi:hypothetical protein